MPRYVDHYGRLSEPPEPSTPSNEELIAAAKLEHDSATIRVYDDAKVDPVDDGAWIEAWVFVPYRKAE
jgi:hypothetical protein